MLRQLFHQMWFQRRANAWIWCVLFIVGILLWYALDILYNYEVQGSRPLGFNPDGVYSVEFRYNWTKPGQEELGQDWLTDYNLLKDYPEVAEAGYFVGDAPFSDRRMYEGYCSVSDSGRIVSTFVRYVSPSFFNVMEIKPLYGQIEIDEWMSGVSPVPVAVTEDFADSLFTRPADAVGKRIYNPYELQNGDNTTYKVNAVIAREKTECYGAYVPMVYLPVRGQQFDWSTFVIKAKDDCRAGFEERFMDSMGPQLERGVLYLLGATSWNDMRDDYDLSSGTVSYLNITRGIIGFFVFTVFLIIFGTFMMRTRRRRKEIAVRMAMGSPRRGIMGYLVSEGAVLLAAALLPALLVCGLLARYDMTVNTLMPMNLTRFAVCFLAASVLLFIIITIAIFPAARRAMKIDPAVAIKDE